jgi:hypothetical protein
MPDIQRSTERGVQHKRRRHLAMSSGAWVQVRSREEILATLDEHGCLNGMPFMPEMLPYCGKTLQVWKRAHKTCDTIYQSGARRLEHTVHLAEMHVVGSRRSARSETSCERIETRCDGSAHGGCEAACLLFWNEAWLEPVSQVSNTSSSQAQDHAEASATTATPAPNVGRGCTIQQLTAATELGGHRQKGPRYVCQATELLNASQRMSRWDLRQYIEDYVSGNVDLKTFARGALYRFSALAVRASERWGGRFGAADALAKPLMAGYDAFQRLLPMGVPYPRRTGSIPKGTKTPEPALNAGSLHAGSWVRVKSYPEILTTLNTENKNRGLYFDAEHVPYCGKLLRVRSLVSQILDERTGYMLRFKIPAVILEGAYCLGAYSDKRMFCPRAVYPYWRAAWLTPMRDAQRERPAAKDVA